ncbi:MAG: hypothetical protein WCA46_29305 [Actinocatenispora sp.]
MSRSHAELVDMLGQAEQMHHGEAQTALMEDVVRHADAGRMHRLAFAARRSLASAYSVDRQWDKAFPLFSRCLSEYDSRPDDFGPEEDWGLRRWYAHIAQSMAEFPEISLAQLYGVFDDMIRRFRAGGHNLALVHEARRWVAQLARDWPQEEESHQQWRAAGGVDPDSVWDFEAEVERLVLRGDDASLARALAIAEPVLSGEISFDEPPAPIQCLMLLPLARAGRTEEAARALHRARRTMEQGVYRYEYSGMAIEFCALTGNEDTGLTMLRERLNGYLTLSRPNGRMEFATAGAVLLRRLVLAGRGTEPIRANGSDRTWPAAALQRELEDDARELATRFDARNGTTNQGDRIRARLGAEPVVDFLPLSPTARPAVRPVLPPPGTPPETILDRAEWHHARQEQVAAAACLAAIGTPPPHLAARHAMLGALLDWDADDVEPRIRWATEALRAAGDHRRHLLGLCWLGNWLACHERPGEGLPMVSRAVGELHRHGDHQAIGTGELRYAQALVAAGRDEESYQAVARGAEHARAARDPLLAGSVALVEANWREYDEFPPGQVLALATAAREAFTAARVAGEVVRAYDLARRIHERAGTPQLFVELVERDLAALPPSAPALLRGYLRYRRGVALIATGRAAEALDDMIDAVGEARSRDADTAEQGHELAVVFRAAGRIEDSVQAAEDVAGWLDRLRELGALDDPEVADLNRTLLAEGYRLLGDDSLALAEYGTVATQAAAREDWGTVVVALADSAETLGGLDRDAEAAAAYRQAGDAARRGGDRNTAALCLANEALSLHWAGTTDRAVDVLADAERAVRALPAEPADLLAANWAGVYRTGAYLLGGVGRVQEAVDRAARAAAAYRQAGVPEEAVRMELLRGRILLTADRPDLAEPVLRSAVDAADGMPVRAAALDALAETLERVGRSDEADRVRAGRA